LLELLKNGEIDVAAWRCRCTRAGDDAGRVRQEIIVARGEDPPGAKRKRESRAQDLKAPRRCLLGHAGHCFRDQVLRGVSRAVAFSRLRRRDAEDLRSSSLDTIRHMWPSGLGVTVLPRTSIREAPRDALLEYGRSSRPCRPAVGARLAQVFTRTAAIEALRQSIRQACRCRACKMLPDAQWRTGREGLSTVAIHDLPRRAALA